MTKQETPDQSVLEIYQLAVEMADRISARRALANAFFLTVNTTLVAVIGLRITGLGSVVLSVSVCVAGVAVAACWWLLLEDYRRLNEAKFAVINRIEAEHLPIKIFTDEWAVLDKAKSSGGRAARAGVWLSQLGGVERIVPMVFGLLYVVLLVGRLIE